MAESSIRIRVNGTDCEVRGASTQRMLLPWLREQGLTGTKEGCAEGDCGACTVTLQAPGQGRPQAFNSCIAPLASFDGCEITTVEGLADAQGELHPVQEAMVQHDGSQCGFCTPGFVMSLYEAWHRPELASQAQVNDQLAGNICRCTGYRSIRDAACKVLLEQAERPAACSKASAPACASEAYREGEGSFHYPENLEALFAILEAEPQARLVAGATEIGVEINKLGRDFPCLVSTGRVAELQGVEASETGWRVGGAATFSEVEVALGGAIPAWDRMNTLFASRQIRNRASLAGNLATASPIGDSAPLLLAMGATLELASAKGTRELPLSDFFLAYRKTALEAGEIILSIFIPRIGQGESERLEFYKVSRRREMDISIVALGAWLKLDAGGVVEAVRLALGGVAERSIRVEAAETCLLGQKLEAISVRKAVEALRGSITPISDARGSADYRLGVAGSLLEKFLEEGHSESVEGAVSYARGERWKIEDASRDLAHESSRGHVSGAALYVDDLAEKRGCLELWPVCSEHAHARILSLDTSAAEAAEGVSAVLTHKDIPGHNDVGCNRKDEPLLAEDLVQFHGHPIAVVVGESKEAVRAAAKLVEVEYEPLEPILSIEEAMAKDSYHLEPNSMGQGDPEAVLPQCEHIIEGVFSFGGQEQFYLEAHAAWADFDSDGDLFVSSSTQHPSEVQAMLGEVLDLPSNRVTVQCPRMGGGFGGKETQGNHWACLTALASMKCSRPARIQLDRDLDMQLTGKRHPFRAEYKVGCDAEGRLQAAIVHLVSDGGWSLDLSMPVTDRALFHLDNCYYIPNSHYTGTIAKTHVASNTAFRGFGGPQGMLVIEEIMDRVARTTGQPPHLVRERNFYGERERNLTHYGQLVEHNRTQRIWSRLLESSEYVQRREAVATFNRKHGQCRRGLAITPVKFGISFTLTHYNQAGALIHLYKDGTLQVNHGGTEMGQGLHTKILGICMRELGLPQASIRLMKTQTDKVPNTSATAASSGSDLNGAAVRDAIETLKARLQPLACKLLACEEARELLFEAGQVKVRGEGTGIAFTQLVEEAYKARISLSATGYYKTPEIHWDRAKGKGKPFHYFAYGAAVTEVEVDGYTGQHQVRRVDILHDVGDSLNPGIDRGQVEGGYVQGLGWLTSEELKWDAQGRLMTHSASTYAVPAISDAPSDFRIEFLPDAAQVNTIHGSKAVGEPPLMLAFSAREALREAVASWYPEGTPVDLPSPATCEAIYQTIRKA